MPVLPASSYRPPPGFRNPHLQTIWAGKLRRVEPVAVRRERLTTPDGDFLDVDLAEGGHDRLAVVSHGLEGNSNRAYVVGMVRALAEAGFDVAAWNLRGCSGEPNRLERLYHSGATGDLDAVVQALRPRYEAVVLVGFSLGGNLTLKYLGEAERDPAVRAAVAFSVPVDLAASARVLDTPSALAYRHYFLRSLRRKVLQKAEVFPDAVAPEGLRGLGSLRDFDDRFTAPLHGFRDAYDYYARASSKPHLAAIRVPTLLVNALDDPFLARPACFPRRTAAESRSLFLETPRHGGHVGFVSLNGDGSYWSERRAVEFLSTRAAKSR